MQEERPANQKQVALLLPLCHLLYWQNGPGSHWTVERDGSQSIGFSITNPDREVSLELERQELHNLQSFSWAEFTASARPLVYWGRIHEFNLFLCH